MVSIESALDTNHRSEQKFGRSIGLTGVEALISCPRKLLNQSAQGLVAQSFRIFLVSQITAWLVVVCNLEQRYLNDVPGLKTRGS
jgi:hypothetical protein